MAKCIIILLVLCSLSLPVPAQVAELPVADSMEDEVKMRPVAPANTYDPGYRINPAIDIPITAVGVGWSSFAFTKIYNKDASSVEEILALDKNDLNGFDRWAAGKHSKGADQASNYIFYGSIPVPLLLLADREIRRDAPKIGFMYLEAMAITGLLYTAGDYFVDRYRPETYATDLPADTRQNGNSKNSFFAGHVALVSTATFFAAQVYADYHPESRLKWVWYGGAAAATGVTIYLRYSAGKHFPSDILVGTAVGTLTGLLVPRLHRNRACKERGWGLSPAMNGNGGYGVSLRYRF